MIHQSTGISISRRCYRLFGCASLGKYARFTCLPSLLRQLQCKKHADMLEINPERIVLIGGSAGANIVSENSPMAHSLSLISLMISSDDMTKATVLALKCRDEHITGIVGQILNIPVTCHPDLFPSSKYKLQSYERNGDAPVLSATLMRWFWGKYLPNPSSDAYACPLLAESLAGMPPACESSLSHIMSKIYSYAA